MDRRLILLLIPLLLAGCTAFSGGGEASDAPPAQGLVIKEASLQNTAIPQDGKTELTLHLANTGTTKIEDATIAISNTGPLEVTGQPAGDKCDIGPQPFTGVSVGAATEGVPRRVICRVTIIGADAREGEYPLTVRVQYGNTLRMQKDSPTITFDDQQNLAAPPVTRTYSNGETSLGVTVPPRVPKDEDSVELELRFQNVGQGRVVATEKDALPAASISVD
ncbi:MAG: hypothetical protein SVW02_03715, partial [Candidatus Nanohaloarchaea archaeon]|nr:hypothetical protein [Candidatus Nanohaloarchaea archaeon]